MVHIFARILVYNSYTSGLHKAHIRKDIGAVGYSRHHAVFIVNHGDEGIEGQIGNVDTAQQQYYVKSQDK